MRLICLLLAFAPLLASGQTLGDYRSFQSGPWSAASSWARFDGSIWVNPAPAPPSSATAGVVTIRLTHTITVTAAQDTDETVVQVGGTLTINSGVILTITDGNLTDLSNSGTINSFAEADLVFSNGSSYAHARNGGTIPPATWNNGSTCSVTGVTNTAPGGLNPSGGFFHFVWNSPQSAAIDLGGNLIDINGDFTVQNSNNQFLRMATSASPAIDIDGDLTITGTSRFAFTTTGSPTIDVGGDFIFSAASSASILSGAGAFNLTVHGNLDVNAPGRTLSFSNGGGNNVFNLEGDFILTAGTITETIGTGTFNFIGTGTQTFTNTGTLSAIIHYTVSASSVLDVIGESLLSGTGTLTVNGGIRLGSLDPLGALVLGTGGGNVRTSGRVYNAGAIVTYAGAGPQFIGNGHPTSATVETEIDNSSGVTFNATTSGNSAGINMVIAGVLRLTDGNLNIESSGGGTRQLALNGSIVDNGNVITFAGTTTNLSIGGTGALGTFPLPAGTSTLFNFTFNRTAGSVDFADSLVATGVTSIQSGTVDFNGGASLSGGLALSAGTTVFFEGQSLAIGGNFTTAGGFLSGDFGSTLTLIGSGGFTSPLAFSPTGNNLSTLVLNKSNAGNSATVSATLNINDALTLTNGQLTIVGNALVLAADADLTRDVNASIATSSPGGGPWDLIYVGNSQTTGLEIPGTGILASLTINTNDAAIVTLAQPVTMAGALTVVAAGRTLTCASHNVSVGGFSNTGTFTAPSSVATVGLTLNGPFVNDGTFNNNLGTVIVDGSVAMSGTTISTTNFNNITISGTGNLFAPPANLIVQGNFTNDGAFTAGSGTIVFDGPVGTKVLSGTADSQFNNVTINKSNLGVSLTVSTTQTVNGTLTLTDGQLNITASQLILPNGATLVKNSSSSISTSSPGGGPWNLVYVSGTQSTSLEIPVTGSLLSLTVDVDDTRSVLLTQAVSVSGAFSIPSAGRTFTSGSNGVTFGSMANSGIFNAPAAAAPVGLTLNGNFVNDGTFTHNSGTVVINAPVTLSGSAMDATLFNTITISATGALTASETLNVQGDFTNNGNFVAGSGTLNFSGTIGAKVLSGTTNTSFNNLVLNKTNAGTSVTVSSPQTVAGTLTLTQGQLAITTSNLQMGNGATLVRNSTASITSTSPGGGPYHLNYVGGSMSTGLEIPSTNLASLTVNSNNAAIITLTTAASVTGAFTNGLAGRSFTCGNNNLTAGTFSNTGTFTTPSSSATTGLTLNGNFVNDGTFTHNSGTVVVNGASTLSGSAIDATLFNTITVSGTGVLTPSTTLNVQGNFTNNGSFVAGSGTVNFSGSVGARVLSGTTNTSFNNLVLNKTNAGTSLTVSSPQTVAGTLTLTQGQLAITSSNLQMGNGATLVRNSTASITSTSPGGGPYHLSYVGGSMSTGLEIPATSLASMAVNSNNAAVITLNTAASVTGAFTNGLAGRSFTCGNNDLTVGTFSNAGTFTAPSATAATGLTLNGNFVNDGTFTNNSGTIRVAGTVAMSGTAINTTNFRTIIITGSLTPSSTLNVQGSFTNDGTFVAGAGTVNFSGTIGGMTLSGTTNTSFNNVTLAKTNVGVSVTVASSQTVTNTLTLTQGQLSITTSFLQLSNGATLVRNSIGSIVTTSPGGGPWNLIYIGGSMTTGLEIPTGNLQSLTVSSNSAAVVTLGSNLSIVGAFTINAQAVGPTFTSGNRTISAVDLTNGGVFNAPSPAAITLTSNLINNGTFNKGVGTVIFAGSSTIAGTNNPTLHHATITGTLTSPSNLLIAGNFTNNGTFNANGGSVSFNGATIQSIAGSTTTLFKHINANNTAGVRVDGTGNLGGVLTLAAGVQFDADGSLGSGVFTVLSLGDNPTADGSIATIPGTSSVTGAVTVQRYMRAKGNFNRYISAPVSAATVTALSDDFNTDGIRYYDETVQGTASLGYVYLDDTDILVPGRGHLVFMWDGVSNITWDLRGPLTAGQNQGAVNLNVSHTLSSPADPNSDGWNLVGNPYASGIHWDNGAGWSKTDIAPIISVPDPAAGPNVFRTWNADTQTGTLPGGIVTMGQAFWVYVDLPGGSLIVNESAKTSTAGTFYREQRPDPVSTLTLSLTHNDVTDDSFITIQPNATDDYDRGLDGPKFPSVFSIATTGNSGRHMVFNAVARIGDAWSMPVYVNGEEGTYSMKFSQQGNFERFEDMYLLDTFKGQSEKISGTTAYEFEITSDEGSKRNRFYLTLNPGLAAVQDEGIATISVYPNPMVDEVKVEITGKFIGETVLLNEVGGLVERIVMIRDGDRFRGTVSVGQQSTGMYFIKSVVDGRLMAIKLIKN